MKNLTRTGIRYFTPTRNITIYRREMDAIPLITPEEEVKLAQRIKQGDQGALNKLVKANLKFAFQIASEYQHFGLSFSDLTNEANLGLIRAAETFDETRGFKFISYAVRLIRQSCLAALVEKAKRIRVPAHRLSQNSKINKLIQEYYQKYMREITDDEIAEKLKIKERYDIVKVRKLASRQEYSIDAPYDDEEDDSVEYKDIYPDTLLPLPTHSLDYTSVLTTIKGMLQSLDSTDTAILELSFGLGDYAPMHLKEIGSHLGMCKETVRTRRKKALINLRKNFGVKLREARSYLNTM